MPYPGLRNPLLRIAPHKTIFLLDTNGGAGMTRTRKARSSVHKVVTPEVSPQDKRLLDLARRMELALKKRAKRR